MNNKKNRPQLVPQPEGETADNDSKQMRNLFFGIFLGVGLVTLMATAITGFFAASRMAREVGAPGVVVTLVSRFDSDGNEFFYPLVEFKLPNGSEQRVQILEGSWPPAYRQGQTVTILYDPQDPDSARIQSFGGTLTLWIAPLITGFVGVIFVGVAIITRKVLE